LTDTETIYCPDCGAENLPWADFCRICGKEFSRFPGVGESGTIEQRKDEVTDNHEKAKRGGYDSKKAVALVSLLVFFTFLLILRMLYD